MLPALKLSLSLLLTMIKFFTNEELPLASERKRKRKATYASYPADKRTPTTKAPGVGVEPLNNFFEGG